MLSLLSGDRGVRPKEQLSTEDMWAYLGHGQQPGVTRGLGYASSEGQVALGPSPLAEQPRGLEWNRQGRMMD